MQAETVTTPSTGSSGRWAARVGGATFAFFLIKGLAWIVLAAAGASFAW